MQDNTTVEDIVQVDPFQYEIDIVDRSLIVELAWSIGKYYISVQLLRDNSNICCSPIFNTLFNADQCPSSDHSNKTSCKLKEDETTCN